jgi:carbon-monoxide dehydrogenase large subunit
VRWRSTRQEGFLTDNQARDTIIEGRLAMDTDGKFLALDIDSIAALGAYHTSHGAFIATVNFARCLPCMYEIPVVGLRIRCLFTNTVPTGPYRGAGRPEANYCLERLVDEAARITGIAIYPISSACCTRCAARPTRSASRASARLARRPPSPR